MRNHYDHSFGGRDSQQVGDQILRYFEELFSLEMPLGKMMKMMPGMVKFALRGPDCRRDLLRFAPQMGPMIAQAMGIRGKDKEAGG